MKNTSCNLKRKPSEDVSKHLMEDFLPYYRYATITQICRLYRQPENIVQKSICQLQRIGAVKVVAGNNGTIIQLNAPSIKIDYARIRSFWVLLNAMKNTKIEFHQPGSGKFGVLINFIFKNTHYEIHYCSAGNYTVCNALMKISDESYESDEFIPQKIILVDDISDIQKLHAKHIYAFATATIAGEVKIFKGKG